MTTSKTRRTLAHLEALAPTHPQFAGLSMREPSANEFTPEELRAGLLSHCALPSEPEPAPQVTEKIERDGTEE